MFQERPCISVSINLRGLDKWVPVISLTLSVSKLVIHKNALIKIYNSYRLNEVKRLRSRTETHSKIRNCIIKNCSLWNPTWAFIASWTTYRNFKNYKLFKETTYTPTNVYTLKTLYKLLLSVNFFIKMDSTYRCLIEPWLITNFQQK